MPHSIRPILTKGLTNTVAVRKQLRLVSIESATGTETLALFQNVMHVIALLMCMLRVVV